MKSLSVAFCLTVFSFVIATISSGAEELRTWNDASGKFSVVAELLDFDGTTVRLKRENGKTVNVPFEKLSPKDREFLEKQNKSGDKSDEDENPFAGGELPPNRSGSSKAETSAESGPPGEAITPIDASKIMIPQISLDAWNYQPDPAPEVVLEKPAKVTVFSMDQKKPGTFRQWSGFHFNPAKPSQVLVSVFSFSMGRGETDSFTRLFSGDTKTGKVVWTDIPKHFKLLGVSPGGDRILLLEGPLQDVHSFGTRTKVHVYRFTDELNLTRVSGFEPFRAVDVPPEEEDEDRVVLYESKTRYATGGSRGTFSQTITHSPNVTPERKDSFGRTLRSPGARRTGSPEDDVVWGTWTDTDHVLLLSGSNGCLISLDVNTGKAAWSIPSGSFGHAVLSSGKRYALFQSDMNLNRLMNKKTLDSLDRKSAMLIFDMQGLKWCGHLETDHHMDSPIFSPDGKTVAASWECAVHRWDMNNGKPLESIYYSYPYGETSGLLMPNYGVMRNQGSPNPFRWVNNRYILSGAVLIDTLVESPVWRYTGLSGDEQECYGGYYWFASTFPDDAMKLYPLSIPHPAVPRQEQTKPDADPYVVNTGTPVAVRVEDSVTRGRLAIAERLEKTVTENGWILKPDAEIMLVARVTENSEKKVPRYEIEIRKDGRSLWRVNTHPGASRLGATQPSEQDLQRADYTKWFVEAIIPSKIREDESLGESNILKSNE